MVHFFHEGGGPYLKGEKPLTPSSISNTGLIDGVPPLSANEPLRFIRIIYMGQAQKSNIYVEEGDGTDPSNHEDKMMLAVLHTEWPLCISMCVSLHWPSCRGYFIYLDQYN